MSVILRGGYFDGKTVEQHGPLRLAFAVLETCGREYCSPHFSTWIYDREGEFITASTFIGGDG